MVTTDLSILIADDHEMNRWLLAEQMQHWSEDISLACNGREAWELLQENQYSLVFIDVNMPVMNGHELIKKVRAGSINQSVPMIAITAHIQNHDRHLLIADGFNECLIKPIVLADLQRVVSHWCVPASGKNDDYYADAILEKVQHNKDLGQVFLQKLFADTPEQIARLERSLQNQEYKQASEIAHKLHGTFCFYGFEDFRALAAKLEQFLWDADIDNAIPLFHQLAVKFTALQNMKPRLTNRFDLIQN